MTLTQLFTNIANAIRSKKGTSGTIVAENFPQEIASIDTSYNAKATYTDYSGSGTQAGIRCFHFAIEDIKDYDLTNYTMAISMFNEYYNLKNISVKNANNITNVYGMFSKCANLESAPFFDTSNVTNMSYMFRGATKIKNIPVYNTTSVLSFSGMFDRAGRDLTDQSLDNILQMCINATSYTETKKLSALKLSSTYVPNLNTRIPNLPHYQDFLDAGWTIS